MLSTTTSLLRSMFPAFAEFDLPPYLNLFSETKDTL